MQAPGAAPPPPTDPPNRHGSPHTQPRSLIPAPHRPPLPPPPSPPPQITIVGRVVSTAETGLAYVVNIDDGTGKAAVKSWVNEDGACVGCLGMRGM